MTPYFLPDSELISGLATASLRGVDVQILVPWKSNLRMVDWAGRAGLKPLLERGVDVYFTPQPFDHTKIMVVDGVWTFLGSANWDPRSLTLNFEFNVECYDTELARAVHRLIARRRTDARRVGPEWFRSRSSLVHLRDSVFRLFSPYL